MTLSLILEEKVRRAPKVHYGAPATVTVVVPCFNHGHFLGQAVDSALGQAGVAVDVIIVDDKSTDNSGEVARGLAALHPRVRVLENRRNAGPAETFNRGLAEATGEFLVRLDANDMLTPGSLKRAVDVAREHPNVGLVYGHPLHFTASNLPTPHVRATAWTIWPGREWLAGRCRSGVNVITSPEVLMRRSVVEQAGGQRHLKHTHDMEMWLRLAAYGDVAYIHGADQTWHREHAGSMPAREVNDFMDLRERREAFAALFDDVASVVPNAPLLHSLADDALANEALEVANHEFDSGRGTGQQAQACIDFAIQTAGDVTRLPAWKGHAWRCRLAGPARPVLSLPPRMLGAAGRRMSLRRWHREGIF